MNDQQRIPRFRATDDLKDILGDLRSLTALSQNRVSQMLGCAHTTVTRYESGQIKPAIGYLAFLAQLLWMHGVQHYQWSVHEQDQLRQQINHVVGRFFLGARPYATWDDLATEADRFVDAFRGTRRSHRVMPIETIDNQPGAIRQLSQTIMQKIDSLHVGRPIDQCAARILSYAAYLSDGADFPKSLLLACAPLNCAEPEAALERLIMLGLLKTVGMQNDHTLMLTVPTLIADLVKHMIPAFGAEAEIESGMLRYAKMVLDARDPTDLRTLQPLLRRVTDRALLRYDQVAAELGSTLGWLLCLLSDYTSARYYLECALHRAELCNHAESDLVLRCLNALAVLYQCQGLLTHAQRTIERVIVGWSPHAQNAYQISTAQNNLGRILIDRGDFAGARSLFQQALPTCIADRGEWSDETARIYSNLGYCATLGGANQEARAALQLALTIRRAVHPPLHPTIAFTLSYLGLLELREWHAMQAMAILEEAAAMLVECYGADYTDLSETLRYLGVAQLAVGKWQSGCSTLRHSLLLAERGLGRDHLEYVRTLDLLLQHNHSEQNSPQHRNALQQIVSIYQEQLIRDHPDTLRLQSLLHKHVAEQSVMVIPNLVTNTIPMTSCEYGNVSSPSGTNEIVVGSSHTFAPWLT